MSKSLKVRFGPLALFGALLASCTVSGGIDFSKRGGDSNVPATESVTPIDPSTPLRFLFVGNSFTYFNDMPTITEKIGLSLGLDIQCSQVTKGAQRLSDTAKSSDELGAQYDAMLNEKTFTHVILQEHSTAPVNDYSSFKAGAKACMDKALAKSPEAKIRLYATWSFEAFANSKNMTIPESEYLLRDAYNRCAKEIGAAGVDHVGKAFSYVYEHEKSINLYSPADNKHPNFAGSYLSAMTHLMTITGIDARSSTYLGEQGQTKTYGEATLNQWISAEEAAKLKQVAYEVAHNLI